MYVKLCNGATQAMKQNPNSTQSNLAPLGLVAITVEHKFLSPVIPLERTILLPQHATVVQGRGKTCKAETRRLIEREKEESLSFLLTSYSPKRKLFILDIFLHESQVADHHLRFRMPFFLPHFLSLCPSCVHLFSSLLALCSSFFSPPSFSFSLLSSGLFPCLFNKYVISLSPPSFSKYSSLCPSLPSSPPCPHSESLWDHPVLPLLRYYETPNKQLKLSIQFPKCGFMENHKPTFSAFDSSPWNEFRCAVIDKIWSFLLVWNTWSWIITL